MHTTHTNFNRALSCLVIEYIVSPSFCKSYQYTLFLLWGLRQFSRSILFHDDSICLWYFCCNQGIEGAGKAFTNISLNEYSGENISDLASTAIRHTKVMRGTYALTRKLGTTLFLKIWRTSSDNFNKNILNYYADTDEMENKYFFSKTFSGVKWQYLLQIRPSWGFGVSSGWVWKTFVPVTEENTAPAQGTYDNSDYRHSDGRKCYKCGSNNLPPDCPWLKQSNTSGNGGRGGDGRYGHGYVRGNGDRRGFRNGAINNSTRDSRYVNRKPMDAWKYINTVDQNTAVGISGTTLKFCKKCFYSVTDKSGFYNLYHTTSEHCACDTEVGPPKSQYDDTPTPESKFASSPDPPCNLKKKEASD